MIINRSSFFLFNTYQFGFVDERSRLVGLFVIAHRRLYHPTKQNFITCTATALNHRNFAYFIAASVHAFCLGFLNILSKCSTAMLPTDLPNSIMALYTRPINGVQYFMQKKKKRIRMLQHRRPSIGNIYFFFKIPT